MDVTRAVLETVSFCAAVGIDRSRGQMVATAVAELARNIVKYAARGGVILRPCVGQSGDGVEVVVEDEGPGIDDVEQAMQDHFSSSGTLGLGLPGVKRMMDEFSIESQRGRGTRVKIRKWR
jgi:serine/threonine-protein kinase RsbT